MPHSVRVCLCFAVMLLLSGCVFSSREVTVSQSDSPAQQREYFRNELINPDGLALESENFLRGNLMQNDFGKNPRATLNKLNEYYKISGNAKFLIIAADLCRYLAARSPENEAIRYHLASYYYCTSFARAMNARSVDEESKLTYDFTSTQALQDYNEACCGIFSFLRDRNLLDNDAIQLCDVEGHSFVMGKPIFQLSIPREAIEDFSLCASYTVDNLMQINRQPGLGVPLVAKVKLKQWYSSLKTPKGLTIPVTLLVKRETNAAGEETLRLVFIDTGVQEILQMDVANFGNMKCAMALDFSTPLACFLNELPKRNLLGMMLDAFDQESTDGLYMVEPYQPGKIPVVFIHGLMSSPETWVQMINSLKNDPSIRKRYQFWFFSYSTGAPVSLSAKKLRNALFAAQKEFCTTPEGVANFNRMVLVGHSMGGLLTRLMLQKEPHYILEHITKMPWSEITAKLQPEEIKLLESFSYVTLPFVHRAVFMAVPHRGAEMAKSLIATLGVYLIKLPASILKQEAVIKRIMHTVRPELMLEKMRNRFYTGIDNLDPDNRFVRALGSSPMKDDLVYHCVIGNKKEGGVPGNSDGVVPYWSSHLDDAASELVVKSDHSVHRRPEAIQELLRILLLHLKSVDGK